MEIYLEESSIYVEDVEDRLIYKVKSVEMYNGRMKLLLNLELEYGWGFINQDISVAQGWVKADRFSEELQHRAETCYIMTENVRECLESNGYIILDGALQEILRGGELCDE